MLIILQVLLLLTMVSSEFCRVICAVPSTYIGSVIDIGFFSVINIGYQKNIKIESVHLYFEMCTSFTILKCY